MPAGVHEQPCAQRACKPLTAVQASSSNCCKHTEAVARPRLGPGSSMLNSAACPQQGFIVCQVQANLSDLPNLPYTTLWWTQGPGKNRHQHHCAGLDNRLSAPGSASRV